MLSSLLRPSRRRKPSILTERSPLLSPGMRDAHVTGARRQSEESRSRVRPRLRDPMDDDEDDGEISDAEEEEDFDEDGRDEQDSLLPLFAAATLDALPTFELTHTVRLLVTARCETTLSWDQLRSPQVSQFLLRPIQQELRSSHFSACTEYALMANCLQFTKEVQLYPGMAGTNKTRAMLCELLAIRLLKEYTTRELIDALSYDFDPLQGFDTLPVATQRKTQHRPARISCLEVAVRAGAKRFLAHPMVVQHLEAIWDGSIVFHSAADSLHRRSGTPGHEGENKKIDLNSPDLTKRRAVTLYDPRDASLFKLSRLRVPRYRNILSTMSFAVLLGLFLAVLIQRSLEITSLEVVFWFWAAGYMLDEIIGFSEQGFSLYIASFWNTFDLGILLLLFIHLCMRIYGIVMPDVRKHTVANWAYDVLAADAILLFPRLFSVLDHYRYFSQLLIAFRMMAQDLVAVFVLIIISCSGFFVALTLSFGNEGIDTPASVAYALLQILMGFTPAAWDRWNGYTFLGKAILTLFLFICHFLVVTILITVLTNSFMAIVQNANEEHQFVFAVNAISAVKSDALFSYVAPTNILQWLLTPTRYILPFRQYLKLNRTVIKITHFPILWTIYLYERMVLQPAVVDRTDMVESRGRSSRNITPKLPRLAREPSIATFRQDKALEEVFRRPYDSTNRTKGQSQERRKTSNVVTNWIKDMDDDGAGPPQEQDRKIVDRLESRRPSVRRMRTASTRNISQLTMSVVSDPEEFTSHVDLLSPDPVIYTIPEDTTEASQAHLESRQTETDGEANGDADEHEDADDELVTNDNEDDDKVTEDRRSSTAPLAPPVQIEHFPNAMDYFSKRSTPRSGTPRLSGAGTPTKGSRFVVALPEEGTIRVSPKRRPKHHMRNVSSATMIFNPPRSSAGNTSSAQGTGTGLEHSQTFEDATEHQVSSSKDASIGKAPEVSRTGDEVIKKSRPNFPSKEHAAFRSTPNLARVMRKDQVEEPRRRPSVGLDLVSDIGDNKAIGGGYVGALPASFATQMAMATGGVRQSQKDEDRDMISRLMMTRMNSLEEGLREVIHEMRETRKRDLDREKNQEKMNRNLVYLQRQRDKARPGTAGEGSDRPDSPLKETHLVESTSQTPPGDSEAGNEGPRDQQVDNVRSSGRPASSV